jgi:lipoprotein-releasing system permease protein
MYKLLLCWRYLQTRYLALACVISVMLGVATLIVVNSVMSGFSTKLRDRLHALLSDVVIESYGMDGFPDPDEKMRRIRTDPYLAQQVEAMTPTMEVFAMIQFSFRGEVMTRPVRLIGVDPATRSQVGGFREHVVDQKGNRPPEDAELFTLSANVQQRQRQQTARLIEQGQAGAPLRENEPPPPDPPPSELKVPVGVIIGHAIASFRDKNAKSTLVTKDIYLLDEGDEVILTTVSGARLSPVYDRFVVCDYFKSEMSEYDSSYVFVPLDYLQKLRTMEGRVTSLQLKLKDYGEAKKVVEALRQHFPQQVYQVQTWEDKQGPLLAAISIEKGILNILLFLIIAVAGFGILAIFSMIVVEKTRDIGILKALGASRNGVMAIFLGYGLLLGAIGAGLGTVLGLGITYNINPIEKGIAKVTGQDIFDRTVYYFDEIPTDIAPSAVIGVVIGSVLIAVLFSVLPSLRAAMLHPVRALRYE